MPKGTPVNRQLTRTINARVLDEHYDYLVSQIDEDSPNLSTALRQAILKAQILDRALKEGRLPEIEYLNEDDPAIADDLAADELERATLTEELTERGQ